MITLSKKQYESLLPYYDKLKSAKYSKTILIIQMHLIRILETTYGNDWRSHVSNSVLSCGSCKIKELSKICTLMENYEKGTQE